MRWRRSLFNEMNVKAFFLEYDTDRAGGFGPLRFLPSNKMAVLGLMSSKMPALESEAVLTRRIDEASKRGAARSTCDQPAMRICQLLSRQPADDRRGGSQAAPPRRGRRTGMGYGLILRSDKLQQMKEEAMFESIQEERRLDGRYLLRLVPVSAGSLMLPGSAGERPSSRSRSACRGWQCRTICLRSCSRKPASRSTSGNPT